jgi:hypothetical protein
VGSGPGPVPSWPRAFPEAPTTTTSPARHAPAASASSGDRIESTAGPRGAGAEIQRARQVADQLIARARDLAARFPTNGFVLLPEPAAWLQTAEGEYAAVWGQDTAEIWADLAATGERVGQPHPVAVAHYREADALLHHHGDRGRARHCADAAFDVAERLGAGPTEG